MDSFPSDAYAKADWSTDRDIVLSHARVIYLPERGGWSLPGGHITKDYEHALQVAQRISALVGGYSSRLSQFAA